MIIPYKDKFDHFMYLFFGTTCLLYLFTPANSEAGVWVLALWVAVVKEFYDGANNTMKEHLLDILAGMLGATGAIILWS